MLRGCFLCSIDFRALVDFFTANSILGDRVDSSLFIAIIAVVMRVSIRILLLLKAVQGLKVQVEQST